MGKRCLQHLSTKKKQVGVRDMQATEKTPSEVQPLDSKLGKGKGGGGGKERAVALRSGIS